MNPVNVQYAIHDGKIFIGQDWHSNIYAVSKPIVTDFVTSVWNTREEAEEVFTLATPSYPEIKVVRLLTYVEDEK